MPFKSKAQRSLFYAKAARGEISKATLREWERATKGKKLPERLKAKIKAKRRKWPKSKTRS